jgi:hypothetical protein
MLQAFRKLINILRNTLLQLKFRLRSFKTVPPGFIYIQLPNQIEPNLLWPKNTWRDVTSLYAGLFFRALGGDASAWTEVQI